jgi:hypothetical protein
MKTDPKQIIDPAIRAGYERALRDYEKEIKLGSVILEVLDDRYEFAKEDYD